MVDNTAEIEADIFNVPLDNEAAKVEEKKLLPPEGWYTTELPITFTPKKSDDGRRVARYFGTFINNKDSEVRAKAGFGMSPDVRYKDGEEKADFSYRMFLNARKAYIEATGQDPQTELDVIQYVAENPVQVRLIHTPDNEAMIVSVRAVKGL